MKSATAAAGGWLGTRLSLHSDQLCPFPGIVQLAAQEQGHEPRFCRSMLLDPLRRSHGPQREQPGTLVGAQETPLLLAAAMHLQPASASRGRLSLSLPRVPQHTVRTPEQPVPVVLLAEREPAAGVPPKTAGGSPLASTPRSGLQGPSLPWVSDPQDSDEEAPRDSGPCRR